jgi:hypothetical protein
LLNDADGMAPGDSIVGALIGRIRKQLFEVPEKDRGRKFSPLIQEYLLNADGQVKLWTTFNGNEIAEIFVAADGNSKIDLYLFDKDNKLVDSDMQQSGNCYVSCTPSATAKFRIEIRNKGAGTKQCLLMTN